MTERRFVLADFTYMSRAGYLRLYEAGRAYLLPRAVAHAAAKRGLVATEANIALGVTEHVPSAGGTDGGRGGRGRGGAEALGRHALELVEPESRS